MGRAHQRLRLRAPPKSEKAAEHRKVVRLHGSTGPSTRSCASTPSPGERGLFIGGFAQRIVGPQRRPSRATSCGILQSYVTRPENIVRVAVDPGDLVLFDNRITQHYAPDDYGDLPRLLHRVTVAGDVPAGVDGRLATSSRATRPTTTHRPPPESARRGGDRQARFPPRRMPSHTHPTDVPPTRSRNGSRW